ncbi:MAG: HI0074 family nucleotidyltransferase substrate-binding subunit [Curvibacter sp.]|jgi:nucleotidyltransferase substrate binding protein (TIGR01987 family)
MGADDRFAVALEHFEKALGRLKEALAQNEDDFVRDSIIQRFEFTFETAWKAMYRWLRARGNDVDEEAYSVIPMAFERRLIADEKGWGDMRKFRKKTSHTYDQNVAVEVAAFARQESVPLFDTLARTLKERTDR